MFVTSSPKQNPATQTQQTQKKRYHQLDLPALRQYYHNQYKFKLITAAGYILNLLKIHRKHPGWTWVINKLKFCQQFGIAVRTFDRAIAHLRQAKLISQEGQGKRIVLWWNRVSNTDFDLTPTMAQVTPTMAQVTPTMAQVTPTMAQESSETIEDSGFQQTPKLSYNFSDLLSSESEGFEYDEEEELEQRISYEDETEQGNFQEQPESDEDTFSALPEAPVEKIDPRETWLRSVKLPSLPNAPNDPDAWVRSQLKPQNWHKYQREYAGGQQSLPRYEKTPVGFDAKEAYIRASGATIGKHYVGSQLMVVVNQETMTAAQFMATPTEEFMNKKMVSIIDVFKNFKS